MTQTNEEIAHDCMCLKTTPRALLTYQEVKIIDRIIQALDAKDLQIDELNARKRR